MPVDQDRIILKNRLPFRLGTTSYIIPDDILPNVTMLAPSIDDIELILFESDEISNYPGQSDHHSPALFSAGCAFEHHLYLLL